MCMKNCTLVIYRNKWDKGQIRNDRNELKTGICFTRLQCGLVLSCLQSWLNEVTVQTAEPLVSDKLLAVNSQLQAVTRFEETITSVTLRLSIFKHTLTITKATYLILVTQKHYFDLDNISQGKSRLLDVWWPVNEVWQSKEQGLRPVVQYESE